MRRVAIIKTMLILSRLTLGGEMPNCGVMALVKVEDCHKDGPAICQNGFGFWIEVDCSHIALNDNFLFACLVQR